MGPHRYQILFGFLFIREMSSLGIWEVYFQLADVISERFAHN